MYVRFRQGVAMLYGRFADAQGGIWRIAGGVERNRILSLIFLRSVRELHKTPRPRLAECDLEACPSSRPVEAVNRERTRLQDCT